ncbi:MAG: thiamine phosphate synthase [Enterococcus sp.]
MQPDVTLYLVTNRYEYSIEKFLSVVESACLNGVTMVQLREKELSTREFYELALAVKKITKRYGIPLIINDRIDICLAVNADGLHIGDDDIPVSVARKILRPEQILGVSAKTVLRAVTAQEEGADYLGTGAIFPTKTKQTTRTSLDTLDKITNSVTIPVVAIGGITEAKIKKFTGINIAGICMVSEIMEAENVEKKVKSLKKSVCQLLRGEGV